VGCAVSWFIVWHEVSALMGFGRMDGIYPGNHTGVIFAYEMDYGLLFISL
jgi:hypothetical protein